MNHLALPTTALATSTVVLAFNIWAVRVTGKDLQKTKTTAVAARQSAVEAQRSLAEARQSVAEARKNIAEARQGRDSEGTA